MSSRERPVPQSITDHRKAALQKEGEYWKFRAQKGEWEEAAREIERDLGKLRGDGPGSEGKPDLLRSLQEFLLTQQLMDQVADMNEMRKQKLAGAQKPDVQVEQKESAKPDPISSIVNTLLSKGADVNAVNDFVKKIDPSVLMAMYTTGESNPMIPYMLFNQRGDRPETLTMRDVLDLWKTMPQQGSQITLEGLAQLMGVMMDSKRNQQPETSSVDIFKSTIEFMKPMFDGMAQKDQLIMAERMKSVEDKIINPLEYLKSIKEGAAELGLTGGQTSSVDAEARKLDFELKKFGLETQAHQFESQMEFQKWQAEQGLKRKQQDGILKMIGGMLEGPNSPLRKLIEAGSDEAQRRIKGGPTGQVSVSSSEDIEGTYPCPKCAELSIQTLIPVPRKATSVICPQCKNVFTRPGPAPAGAAPSPPSS